MTGTSTGPSSDKTLGEVLHEVRQAARAGRPRPWPPESWADRIPELRALDEAMAAAVEAAVRERYGARLAEVRETVTRFRAHHAGVLEEQTEALYHAVLQVIDRVPLGGQEQERSEEDEAASPVAADPAAPVMPGQLPLPGTETQ